MTRDQAIGVTSVAALCATIAGANLPNPLQPEYVYRFDLTPLLQGTLFSLYLAALVLALACSVVASRRKIGTPRATLLLALGATLLADAAFLAGSSHLLALFAGRALSGIGVGLATGAAASIALAHLGERARTMVATSAVLGSLGGNLVGGVIGTFLPGPLLLSYLLHGTGVVLIGVPLIWFAPRPAPVSDAASRSNDRAVSPYRRRHRAAGYLLGAIAWSTAGVVLALIPAEERRLADSATLLQAVLPSSVFLASAWIGQIVVRRQIARVRAWHVVALMAGGFALLAWALRAADSDLILIGAVVAGLGQGPAYSLGLATVAAELSPAEQGKAASVFAGVAYASCATVVLAAGAVGSVTSVPDAIGWVGVFTAGVGLLAVGCAGRPLRRPAQLPAGTEHISD
ncbi:MULTISPECIES: MFS transporter [unclassified Curtobacterium]|uniref:MFS transporter n=1 Tax=unclassified Curtobacterium TaxID=257496 RepID=UPI00226B2BDB|nr:MULTISPECIES: MFS transporter [unclassified Curtobacterium]